MNKTRVYYQEPSQRNGWDIKNVPSVTFFKSPKNIRNTSLIFSKLGRNSDSKMLQMCMKGKSSARKMSWLE